MNVYIQSGDITDMQGPCPTGYHVPTTDEWQGLYSIMSGLTLTSSGDWISKLHLPLNGNRYYSSGDENRRNKYGYYWSSSIYDSGNAKAILLTTSTVYYNDTGIIAYGYNIRPFKNIFVTPTSEWTVVYGTLGSAGIFWSQTDGLISITSDGTTGYTIQDKNLGATTVYNNGDTLSESNCGKYYQWGNNYGFPRTGSITTSSTKVDASSYGPGNYYSSSTFIVSSGNWDSSNNQNLRGGVTGPVSMKEVQNIYIGEYGWKPTADTLFYYEFENNFNDSSSKGNNITTTSGVGYDTQGGQYVANLTTGAGYIRIPSIQNSIGTGDFTVSFRLYPKQPGAYDGYNSYPIMFAMFVDSSPYPGPIVFFDPLGRNGVGNAVVWRTTSSNQTGGSTTASGLYDGWHHFVMTRNSGTTKCYIDGQLDITINSDTSSFPTTNEGNYYGYALFGYNGNWQSWRNTGVKGDKVILEAKGWSADDVTNYFNQTKSTYGL